MESRLDLLYRLKKKYGSTTQEMLEYLERSRAELDRIEMAEDTSLKLEKKRAKLLEKVKKKAEELSKKRQAAAQTLNTGFGCKS